MRSRLLFGIAAAVLALACGQTDVGITTSVKTQLAADDVVRARSINVDTRNRVVTLRGEVRTSQEEARALEIARNTEGVTNVVDELQVVIEQEGAPTTGIEDLPDVDIRIGRDAGITAAVKARLLADPDVSGLRINVDTRDGVVTLSGTVTTEAEKSQMIQIARNVEGVRDVTARITVQGGQ